MNSILLTDEERRGGVILEEAHPLEYVHARNEQLRTIQDNFKVQRSVQPRQGIDSVYIAGLFGEYQRKHTEIQQKRLNQMKYLNPNHFDCIFEDKPAVASQKSEGDASRKQKQGQAGRKKSTNFFAPPSEDDDNYDSENEEGRSEKYLLQQERKRREIYDAYIEGSEIDQEQVIGTVFGRQVTKGEQVIYSAIERQKENPNSGVQQLLSIRKDWLKELNQEMNQIQQQNKLLQKKANRTQVCKNNKIVSKLAASLFTQFHVYFDDIFDALINDILQEEAEYFNEVEEFQAKENAKEKPKVDTEAESLKTIVRNTQLSSNLFGLIDTLGAYTDDMNYSDPE